MAGQLRWTSIFKLDVNLGGSYSRLQWLIGFQHEKYQNAFAFNLQHERFAFWTFRARPAVAHSLNDGK
jgi:hypothetical protein